VCNFDGSESRISKNAVLTNIKIPRPISPLIDAVATWKLHRFLRRERFDIVHSVSPKAGLITAVSSWLARTPVRVHWFTGQVWALQNGIARLMFKNFDKLIGLLSSSVLVDSASQRDLLLKEKVIRSSKSEVLGAGSVAGVNTTQFRPNAISRASVRKSLAINDPNDLIILFVGRLTHDKGLDVLFKVFAKGDLYGDPFLVVVGPDEQQYVSRFEDLLGTKFAKFRYVPFTDQPEQFMAASDIFCLPSLREGFGLSIIEAGAVALPSVASRIYGISDSIQDKRTGLLITPNDETDLRNALNELLSNPRKRVRLGLEARKRVEDLWEASQLQRYLREYYERLITSTRS